MKKIYSWIFMKKNRDTLNTNIFRIPSFTICIFNFLVFLTSFFSILHVYGFQKIVKCLCCFIAWIRDFIKKLRYVKYKMSTKFHLFLFYFFSTFDILFYQRFYQRFLENSKSFFKKNIDMWNNFFFKILRFTICFFNFFIFHILFSISSICICQQILEIFMLFYFMY